MAKKTKGQFDNYKKWTTDQGYTFLAKDKEDAELYLKKAGSNLGSLKEVEVKDVWIYGRSFITLHSLSSR